MTSPSQPDGPEQTTPPEPLPPAADEPLPLAGVEPLSARAAARTTKAGTDRPLPAEDVLVSSRPPAAGRAAEESAPDRGLPPNGSNSFAAGFARQHFFSGVRFLKPGRRAAVAVAGVASIAAIAVGVTAGLSQIGGGDHPSVQSAASTKPLATVSGTTAGGTTPASANPTATGSPGKQQAGSPAHPPANAGGQPVNQGAPPPPGAPPAGDSGNVGTSNNAGTTGNTGTSGTTDNSGNSGSTSYNPPPPPAQPPAQPPPDNQNIFAGGLVVNFGASQRCLATSGGSRSAGAQLVLADCNRNDPSQGWTFPSDGTARNFNYSMCLDVSNPGNGALVRLAYCSSSRRANQTFTLKKSFDLVDISPDLCVDAKDKGTAAGTVLQLWQCSGTGNQKWKMG